VPAGTFVSKAIGPAGGELVSADGKLKIKVPSGAVNADVQFGIQPVTNTLFEGNTTRMTYRLLPEGTPFSKPVSLTFTYTDDDLQRTSEDVMAVAWQQPDGAWKIVPARLNKTNKTVTAETTHFSDWTTTGGFELRVDREVLLPMKERN
jgi:hypothetical protein